MDIQKKIALAIKKTGGLITLEVNNEQYSFFAQVQPIHDKSKLYLESNYSSLGKIDRSHAVYFGPCNNGGELLSEGAIIIACGIRYTVKISEPFFINDKIAYFWAVLQRAYGESEGELIV